jgi:YHS domain-containing protein
MKVDRGKAVTKELDGATFYFCSNHCLHAFEADPERSLHAGRDGPAAHSHAAHSHP